MCTECFKFYSVLWCSAKYGGSAWKNSKNYYSTECEGITEIPDVNHSFQKQHKKNFKYQTGDSLVKQPHGQDTFGALTLDTLRYRRHIACWVNLVSNVVKARLSCGYIISRIIWNDYMINNVKKWLNSQTTIKKSNKIKTIQTTTKNIDIFIQSCCYTYEFFSPKFDITVLKGGTKNWNGKK